MAGVAQPADPIVTGSIVIFHNSTNNTILLGEEGKWVFDSDISGHEFNRHNPVIYQTLPDTTQIATPFGKKQDITLTLEQQTEIAMKPVLDYISKSSQKGKLTPGTNLLFPIIERSSKQTQKAGHTSYKVTPRKQEGGKEGGVKGGLKNASESALECILREIYEEVGEINSGLTSVIVTDSDWIRDPTGSRYVTNIVDSKRVPQPYAIFYKGVNNDQAQKIALVIAGRRSKMIGEMFDLSFKQFPSPATSGNINPQTKSALEKVQAYLSSKRPAAAPAPAPAAAGAPAPTPARFGPGGLFGQAQAPALGPRFGPGGTFARGRGGAKKTRRRITRKRRTTSKRR
jgi:hypothetical protein